MVKLEAISVRDVNTKEFVQEITGREALIHLDPVLVYDFETEIRDSHIIDNLPSSYCVIYSYDNRIHKKFEIDSIKEFCKRHHMTPICVGIPQFWIKNYIVTDPFQCLKIFQGADFVITDTFHGTIFSAKYCRRFATAVRGSNKNKLQDLINKIQVSEHQVDKITLDELERVYKKAHDKEKFKALIETERERTIIYLEGSLKK